MVEWEYTIQNPGGFHAWSASKLVTKTVKLSPDIRVSLCQNSTDTKNILEVMALGAGRNSKTLVQTPNEDEEEAPEAVKQVLT